VLAAGTPGNGSRLTKLWRRPGELVRAANSELETAEPWKLPPGPPSTPALGDALEALRIVAVLVSPVMPGAAAEIWKRIGLAGRPDEPGACGGETAASHWGSYPGTSLS